MRAVAAALMIEAVDIVALDIKMSATNHVLICS